MNEELGTHMLQEALRNFQQLKSLADRAIAQIDEAQRTTKLDDESNSIAILMKHLGGNMRSRWTDFLTADGEKPDRHRDAEFEHAPGSSDAPALAIWEEGWRCAFTGVTALQAGDLMREVRIRGEAHTVVQALHRQLTHTAYHVGQIVMLAKHLGWDRWRTLSIPRGQSDAFNDTMRQRTTGARDRSG